MMDALLSTVSTSEYALHLFSVLYVALYYMLTGQGYRIDIAWYVL